MSNVDGISVVIPLYNAKNTIVRTLESICSQTNIQKIKEIVVVNDGSTDGSEKLVLDYSRTSDILIRLINKPNGGVSSARNEGIKSATESWIAFCDSDDVWLSYKIEKQLDVLSKVDADFIGGNHTDKPLKILGKKITSLHKATVYELCIKMFPQTSTILVKKEMCEHFNCFNEDQQYCEDGNLFIKIASIGNYYYIPEQLTIFGDGKRGFGVSGLSANLKGMQQGSMDNLDEFRKMGIISTSFWILMKIFYNLKYIRRIVIVKMSEK